MDENEIAEHRYRFFTEKGISVALEQDRVFITLFTAIIAGLTALVVYDKVSYWSSAFFLVAIALSVFGIAQTLMHMSFTAKVLLHYAAFFGGDDQTPNVVEREPLTQQRLQRNQEYAQNLYFNEIVFLILAVVAAGLGLIWELWVKVLGIAPIVIAGFVVLFVIGYVVRSYVRRRTGQPGRSETPLG